MNKKCFVHRVRFGIHSKVFQFSVMLKVLSICRTVGSYIVSLLVVEKHACKIEHNIFLISMKILKRKCILLSRKILMRIYSCLWKQLSLWEMSVVFYSFLDSYLVIHDEQTFNLQSTFYANESIFRKNNLNTQGMFIH